MANYNTPRPKTLMEILLAKKIEAAAAEGLAGRRLLRTDSMDSVSSIGSCTSSMLGEDVCRCDDCILGIVDLYVIPPQTKASLTKKVKHTRAHLCTSVKILNAIKSSDSVSTRACIIVSHVNSRARPAMRPSPVYLNRFMQKHTHTRTNLCICNIDDTRQPGLAIVIIMISSTVLVVAIILPSVM